MKDGKGFEFRVSEGDEDVAYLKLPDHPGSSPGVVKRSVRLRELMGDYAGADVFLDFDINNALIGIEILV